MKKIFTILFSLLAYIILPQDQFTEQTSISLTGVSDGTVDWGDYDNDNDLDILLVGGSSSGGISKIFRNDGNNTFTEQTSIYLFPDGSSAWWGDYDNDGDLDIVQACVNETRVYRNQGENTFTEQTSITSSLASARYVSVAWGDYDNDGYLDILLTGLGAGDIPISKVYRNNRDNSFTDQTSISLVGVYRGSVDWIDYDNDGDLDILLTGDTSFQYPVSRIYRNDGDNTFSEQTSISLPDVLLGSTAWGDYDNDGNLDLLLSGGTGMDEAISKIYRNNGDNTFSEQTSIIMTGVVDGSVAWGDFDNDGDLDILLTGWAGSEAVSLIYRNDGDNVFTEQNSIVLSAISMGCVAWGDYDNDADLDILLAGSENTINPISKIYRNNNITANTFPTVPINLHTEVNGNDVTFSWDKSTDTETPQNGLKYNLVIGTSPGAVNTLSPMSDRSTGYRRVINLGNTNHNNSWTIKGLPGGQYYWSVQSVDNTFAGSDFAPENSFAIQRNYNDFYYYININKVKMWQSNNGIGSYNSQINHSGFYWPYDENDSTAAVYSDGLLWGGYADGNLKVGGNHHRSGLEAGKILPGGIPDSVTSPRCRVFRIRKGWESLPPGSLRDSLETDYNEWPVQDGAPWVDINENGIFERGIDQPEFIGDEVLWFVANDLDASRTQFLYGSDPIGLEMQVTTFAYDSTNDLADIVFKKYKLINKSGSTINDMYLSYWSDPDLGDATDDFIGCDTLLNLGFTYNANDYDSKYGSPPPAVGYNLLRGPIVPAASYQYGFLNGTWRKGYKNLDMTTFNYSYVNDPTYGDPPPSVYEGTIQTYNLQKGLDRNGNQITNPATGQVTKYCFPGDPVTGNGWTEQNYRWPGDKRHYISMGPFNFADADTQEVMIAILIDKGTDRLNSITELKNKDQFVQSFYYDQFLTPIPDFEIRCNMSNQIKEGAFNPSVDQIKVMANFNAWVGNEMTDTDNDSIYSFTLYNVEFDSLLEFKFWTTPNRWEAYPDSRRVEVGQSPGGYYAYFNDDSLYTPPKSIRIQYICNMSIERQFERFDPLTDQVKLMGWLYWWGTGVNMNNDEPDIYYFIDTLYLGVNDYIPGYKFFYTPDTWEGGENKTYRVTQQDYDNSEIIISRFFNQDELPSVEFQCDMTVQILEGNFDPTTDQVQVRGNFNDWSGTELTDPDNDWIYTNLLFNFEVDSQLVYKFWHSPDTWEEDSNRVYTVISNPQILYDFFNRDDDPTNGERLWEAQISNTENTLLETNFINQNIGWVVSGENGTILNTEDAGNSWTIQTGNTDQSLWSISIVDENTGWAAGNSGTIIKTTDGGENWNNISGTTFEPLREIFFWDINTGWIAGNNGLILKTTDGGNSWNAQTTNNTLRFQSIYFVDSNIGWAVGEGGMIMHTTNSGQDWFLQTSNTTNYLLDTHFENANVGWAVGWNGTILNTTDGGNNWTVQDPKLPPGGIRNRLYNVWFTDLYHGWAVGTYGTIRYTSDGGANWLPQYSGTTQNLFGVMFPSSNVGWIVGGNGTILKFTGQNLTPDDWAVTLALNDAGSTSVNNQITFGQNLNASDGIDPSLNEEEIPPPPPSGIFDVRFILPDPTTASLIDYRNSTKTSIDWMVQFQPGTAGYPISFTWDQNQLPSGSFWLKDLITGEIVNINMRDRNSYTLTNEGIGTLQIVFRKQACTVMDLIPGWNMISIPFEMDNAEKTYLFPSATSNTFGYENQYVVCDSIETGNGYWLRFSDADTLELCGIINPDMLDVQTGWNMVGTFEFNLPINQITSEPPGIIVSNFFGFNNGYQTASSLQPGKGYWVKVNSNGQLIYNRLQKRSGTDIYADASTDWGKIIISDKNWSSTTLLIADKSADLTFYELPPLPPAGVFDVRFSTSKIAERIDSPKDILINSAQYPVVLRVEGTSVKVKDKIDGKRVDKLLKSGEELIITDPNINVVEVVGELIPDKFELSQNYPNPFNPSTMIRFALPVDSKVRISLFNILGELVTDITNQEYDAGYHQLLFTANGLASGVYFYRIEAGKFIDVKKLILLK